MPATSTSKAEDTYIHAMVRRLESSEAEKPVFRYRDRDVGAGDFLGLIYRYARALLNQGIDRTKLVALLAPNSPDAIAIRYAANLVGAAACYLSAPPTEAARRALVAQIKPDLLVAFPETLRLLPVGLDLPTLAVGDCGPAFQRIDRIAEDQSHSPICCDARPKDLAVVISSGGSTGVPKGSCRDFSTYTRVVTVASPADRRQLVNGHLAYLSEILVDMTLLSGGVVVLRDEFEPKDTLRQIERERITDLFLVEPQLFELMDHPDVARTDLSSLRNLVHVGASAPPTLRARARERLGPVISHTYGASEEGLVSLLSASDQLGRPELLTSAGRILPGVEVRLRKKDGSLAVSDEVGTIEVRSLGMAQGYRNRPDLSEQAFKGGWYLSGDLGYLDEDAYLHILGRAVDTDWRDDGRLITLTAIEETLCRLTSVRYAVAVRCSDQEGWIAAVEPWPGAKAVVENDCLSAVADACGVDVKGSLRIIVVGRVPRTEQGKPDRSAIECLGDAASANK